MFREKSQFDNAFFSTPCSLLSKIIILQVNCNCCQKLSSPNVKEFKLKYPINTFYCVCICISFALHENINFALVLIKLTLKTLIQYKTILDLTIFRKNVKWIFFSFSESVSFRFWLLFFVFFMVYLFHQWNSD